jgi:outer membrane protein TolC
LSFISQNITSTLDGNPATAGDYRAWDSKNKSYVGLRVDYQLYDAQKSKQQSAAMAAYLDEKYALMDKQQKVRNDVLTLKNTLSSLLAKRENMLEQIRLNRELLETQKKEVIIDKVTFLEMSKNYLLFNQSYLSLLTLDTQIYDAIFEYGKLNAEKLL